MTRLASMLHAALCCAAEGLLKDLAFGLRLGSNKASLGNVLRIDIAFPRRSAIDRPCAISGPDQAQLLNTITQTLKLRSPARRRFWVHHAWIPAALLALAWIVLAPGQADLWIADHVFFGAASRSWIGAGSWWALDVVHTAGKWLVRLVGLSALVAWTAAATSRRLRALQRAAAFIVAALIVCPVTVGLLQQATNVDCPRDLASYGGERPYVPLFADRPDELPRGQCFPGSHSASGFALMSFYFVLLDPRPRLARRVLAATAILGAVFSFGQQARGAHFLSHDFASAAIVWMLLLALHRRLLEFPAAEPRRLIQPQANVSPSDRFPRSGPGIGTRPATHPAHARRRRAGVRGVFRRLFRARVPLCPAPPQWRRRSDARSRAVHAHESDAETQGLPRRVGPVHLDLPDLPT